MALFVEGNPGGGRPKGARNKIKRLVAALEELQFDPLAFALDKISRASPDKQADCAMELLHLVYGKPTVEKVHDSPESSVEQADILMKQLAELSKPIDPTNDK